ncbi:hypothetical protein [Alicyclobacillus sp. SO9]|nr:hypothetical protein [Alicyclobacillus sp. SO9]QQE77310.1 hypothetical protein GI364_15230 [Alicyclobacillus sp. SO9]
MEHCRTLQVAGKRPSLLFPKSVQILLKVMFFKDALRHTAAKGDGPIGT